jgi:hypothetical protein
MYAEPVPKDKNKTKQKPHKNQNSPYKTFFFPTMVRLLVLL